MNIIIHGSIGCCTDQDAESLRKKFNCLQVIKITPLVNVEPNKIDLPSGKSSLIITTSDLIKSDIFGNPDLIISYEDAMASNGFHLDDHYRAAMTQAAGWMFSECQLMLDSNVDPRNVPVDAILEDFENEFNFDSNKIVIPH